MDTNTYNSFVDRMNILSNPTREYLCLAFLGEAGEVAGEIKKEIREGQHTTGRRRDAILLELGDSLYYLTALSKLYGYTLNDVMDANIKKLEARRLETGLPK